MLVLPAVNERTFEGVLRRFEQAAELLQDVPDDERFIHVDVTDGVFSKHLTWNNPIQMKTLRDRARALGVRTEIHLMTHQPERESKEWIENGAARVVIHIEAIRDHHFSFSHKDALIPAICPETPINQALEAAKEAGRILLLTVTPGRAGQRFDVHTIDKIIFLRQHAPDVTIAVDGGITNRTGHMCKVAGAHELVSASYLWEDKNPKDAYLRLRQA